MGDKITLKPCPICGAKAFISHDKVDGFDMGWSVGCPAFCRGDNIHGMKGLSGNEFEARRLTGFCYPTKERAAKAWNDRCESGCWRISPWGGESDG